MNNILDRVFEAISQWMDGHFQPPTQLRVGKVEFRSLMKMSNSVNSRKIDVSNYPSLKVCGLEIVRKDVDFDLTVL